MTALNFPDSPADGATYQGYTYNATKGVWAPAAASAGGGVTSYADFAAFPSSGNTLGDLGVAQDTKALYMWDGTEWDRIASGSDETPRVTTEPGTTHGLNSTGATSTVTMVAEDPEGFDIEYDIRYNTSGGALPDQLASATTVNQSTGVYTFTPSTTTSNAGNFVARLRASDGNRVTTRNVAVGLGFVEQLSLGTGTSNAALDTYTSSSGMVLTMNPAAGNLTNYDPANLFDGVTTATLTNYWLGGGFSSTGTLTFDFSNATSNSGAAMSFIQKIIVTPYSRSDTFSNITKIETSSDGSTWTQTHGNQGLTSANSGEGVSHTYNLNTSDLYFRISLTKTGSWTVAMNEVVVWGY
tara:strand:- start:186 stop:1247 length:1062 start_codon:yes stop_codon:yes gene_type:complete